MIVSKTRNANGWATQRGNLIPNGVICNEKNNWLPVLRLKINQTINPQEVSAILQIAITWLSHNFNVKWYRSQVKCFQQSQQVLVVLSPSVFISKTRHNTRQKLIPNGENCNVKHNWVSKLRLYTE